MHFRLHGGPAPLTLALSKGQLYFFISGRLFPLGSGSVVRDSSVGIHHSERVFEACLCCFRRH